MKYIYIYIIIYMLYLLYQTLILNLFIFCVIGELSSYKLSNYTENKQIQN